jgi:hypothetical protein
MKKLEVLEALKNQMDCSNQFCGSLYTLEQVIKIVESIESEETKVNNITLTDIEEHIDKVIDTIDSGRVDIIDKSSAEFEISYDNRIELQNVDVDTSEIRDILFEIFTPLVEIDENND